MTAARRLCWGLWFGCACWLGLFVFAGGSAQASLYHRYEAQIPGHGAMTVDGGDLFVNEGARLVEYDASTDAFIAELPASQVGLSGFSAGIAVGHAAGETELYVGASGEAIGVLGIGACGTVACATLQGEWSGTDTPNGSFIYNENKVGVGGITGVAVDGSTSASDWAKGDVFVSTVSGYSGANLNVDVVDVFQPEAGGKEKYVAQLTNASIGGERFEPYGFSGEGSVAVSGVNGDVAVVNQGHVVDVFEPTGLGEYAFTHRLTGPHENVAFEFIESVAVAGGSGLGAGDVLVPADGAVFEFNPAGELVSRISGTPSGAFKSLGSVAVDPASGRVFVSASAVDVFSGPLVLPDTTMEGVTSAKYESASNTWALDLTGSVNPNGAGPATCRFAWGPTPALGNLATCEGTGESAANPVPNGTSPVGVRARVSGLKPDTTYYYRLQAFNENGPNEGEEAQDLSFTTGGPGIHEESASSVTAESATLNALVDPNNSPTSYYFQYGTSTSYSQTVPLPPGVPLGSGKGDLGASVHIQGLAAATVYHYRVVAIGEYGGEVVSVEGSDQTFTTQGAGSVLRLPDGRSWELVSPPDKHGALIGHINIGEVIQASVNGDAMTFTADAPTESEPQGYTNWMQVLSTRGPAGWVSRDISPPNMAATGLLIGDGRQYRFFSEDLSLAVLQPFGGFVPSLSDEASEQTAFLRTNYLHGNVNDPCVTSCYRPLVTAKPGFANVPEGTVFGLGAAKLSCPPNILCGPEFVSGTPDLSRIFLNSNVALTPGGAPYKYEWFDGKLKQNSELPVQRDLTSEDGSWVYSFSTEVLAPGGESGPCSCENLYVTHAGATKLVAVLSGADGPDWNAAGPQERTARVSPNGRWIAFMSQRELTGYDNHDAVSGKPDEEVYLYDAQANGGAGRLVCASCDPTGARPVGRQGDSHLLGTLTFAGGLWGEGSWLAANIPGWTAARGLVEPALYQPRYLSDSGRLFFNSNDTLVAQDVNGTEDVYEYEPAGVGDCTSSSTTFGVRSDGCVGLISSGTSGEESAFLDASGSGGDVFFVTKAKLAPQDYDTALDVYDAHECRPAAPCYPAPAASPPACDTEASCRAAPSPQPVIFGSPSSSTFVGAGNVTRIVPGSVVRARSLTRTQKLARALRACGRKHGKQRRASCKRQARATYSVRRSSKAPVKIGRG
jgi:hypothetical protein